MANSQSRKRLLDANILDLPTDINGFPPSPHFEPFLKVKDLRAVRSLRTIQQGVWSGRPHHLASRSELGVFLALELRYSVLDVREGYPRVSDTVRAKLLAGETILRKDVPTFDYVLTLRPERLGEPLRYLALSHKQPAQQLRPAERRRAARDLAYCKLRNWGLAYIESPLPSHVEALGALSSWARAHPIDEAYDDARELGQALYRTQSRRGLGDLLALLGRRLHIPLNDQFFVFAAACYFGWVKLDLNMPVKTDYAPTLLPPPRG